MSSLVKTLFGGTDKTALKKQMAANDAAQQWIQQMGEQARGDALALAPGAFQNRMLGGQAALDVMGQTIPQQMDVYQQGNVGAQSALLAGLPQIQNAILGLPVNMGALQPQQLNYDASWAQQTLPEFIGPSQLLGGQVPRGGNAGGGNYGAIGGGQGGAGGKLGFDARTLPHSMWNDYGIF